MNDNIRHIALCFCLGLFTAISPSLAYGRPLDLLPSWPVTNLGAPIPDDLISEWGGQGKKTAEGQVRMGHRCPEIKGQFHSFPSKAPANPKEGDKRDSLDPDDLCDDGDQTTYNGMLCASGVEAGCRAVAEAQDATGRWFRSPHRRWVWTARCNDKNLDKDIYRSRCANGFSPDMNLGVLLYTLKTHDIARYQKWLKWLDDFSTTTKLCKKVRDHIDFDDCTKVEWPRVCPEDLAYSENPGIAVDGRYGGQCVLRPPDALDFAAVNDALGIAPPSRMSNWEVKSRALLRSAKETASAIVPIASDIDAPPLLFMSLIERDNFPLHLDAVRVLIRMMTLNPSLRLNKLPELPDVNDALPGALDAAASDATDPASINIAADIIAKRDPSNPFFRLLAEGPTPDVRALIIERCPAIGDKTDAGHWIWEKDPGEEFGKKQHSMGWDCVFVGALYNKMRVKKQIVDELLDRFLKYVDPLDSSLKRASEALQVAEAANALQQQSLDEAERGLSAATDFVNKGYAQQRQAAVDAAKAATDKLKQLTDQLTKFEEELKEKTKLHDEALKLPDKVEKRVTKRVKEGCKVVKDAPGRIAGEKCNEVTKTMIELAENEDKISQLKNLSNATALVEKNIADLKSQAIASAHANLNSATQLIVDLDKRLQSTREELEKGTFQGAVSIARQELPLKAKALSEARKIAAEARRADARVRGFLAVWKNDRASVEAMAAPAAIAPADEQAKVTKSEAKPIESGPLEKQLRTSKNSKHSRSSEAKRTEGLKKQAVRRHSKHSRSIVGSASAAWQQFENDLYHLSVTVRKRLSK